MKDERYPPPSKLDPALRLQRIEEKLCECSAVGSGEGHSSDCPAKKFDRIPRNMTAAAALAQLGYR
ncbi:MAG TPA: hypothetical protein VFB45_15325 [Pseudolabrys sp.]|nr:hypothetical protein [Pseudolabrys sp.]